MKKTLYLLTGIIIASMFSSCTQPPVKVAPVQEIISSAIPSAAPQGPYKIGVGDEIELKFFYTPELNDRMTVRPDGKISIMFAQDIQASGYTAEQLADYIKNKLALNLKQTDLVVIVRTFANQKVYVSGEVLKPGPVVLTGRENLLQVINDAGWVTPLASRDQVMLVRRDGTGNDAIYPINFRRIMSGEDMSQNVVLQAGDIILVPPSDAASVDRWVDQNVRQVIPISTGVFLNSR